MSIGTSRLPLLTGGMVLVAAWVVLTGWALEVQGLQTLFLSSVKVKPNTALGLALAAVAIMMEARQQRGRQFAPGPSARRVWVWVPASLVLLIGVLTLAEYAGRMSLGIDQLVFPEPGEAALTQFPGRMAAITAAAFAALGGGLLLLDFQPHRRYRISEMLLIGCGALALAALLGYGYGVIPTAGLGKGLQIAIPAAICLILLVSGALCLRPNGRLMSTFLGADAGGILARRVIPFAFAVPLALGALRSASSLSALSVAMQSAAAAVLTMLAFGVVIWRTAETVSVADRERLVAERGRTALAVEEEASRARAEAEHVSREVAEFALERAIREAREKAEALTVLETVLATAPIGFALFDRQYRFARVNATLAEMHGAPADSIVGRTPSEVVPHLAGNVEKRVREVFETGKPLLGKSALNPSLPGTAAGDKAPQRIVSYYPVLGSDGKVFAVGLVVVDTSERRQLEEQLAQSQKMEAIGQLAGGVAHDFNNLLTVIMSYSSLLVDTFDAGDERREEVLEISGAAERAAALTGQLLAFSRKQVLQPRAIDVNTIVAGVEKLLRRLIGEDIALDTALDPDLCTVVVDPGQVEQILVNLAVNARDAMPQGGRLHITTANVELGYSLIPRTLGAAPGSYVMVAVSDSGTGMTEEIRKRIFEPFFTTKEKGKGTGLGLSMVYGIVKQSGGDVSLYSEVGVGSVFKLYFPARNEAPTPGPALLEAERTSPRGTETVLVAEDDAALRRLAVRVLRECGYFVLEAGDGLEAIAVAGRHDGPIHLVATDVVMPGMGGRELLETVTRIRPGVRFLFMSGYTDDDVMRRGVLDGSAAFISKPFTPNQFAWRVRSVLDEPLSVAQDESTALQATERRK